MVYKLVSSADSICKQFGPDQARHNVTKTYKRRLRHQNGWFTGPDLYRETDVRSFEKTWKPCICTLSTSSSLLSWIPIISYCSIKLTNSGHNN